MEDLVGRTPVLSAEVERWWKPLPEEEEESTDESATRGRQRPESQLNSDEAVTGPPDATRPRPLGTGSVTTVSKQPRQAAVQAADALHEVYMPDAVAYEKEKRTPKKGMKASSAGNAGKRERDDDDEGGEEDREEIKRKVKAKKANSMEEDAVREEARNDMEEGEAEQGELEEQGDQTLSKKVTPKKDKSGKKAVVARARSASLSESVKEKPRKGRKVGEVVDTSINMTPTKGGSVRVLTTGCKLSEKDKKVGVVTIEGCRVIIIAMVMFTDWTISYILSFANFTWLSSSNPWVLASPIPLMNVRT